MTLIFAAALRASPRAGCQREDTSKAQPSTPPGRTTVGVIKGTATRIAKVPATNEWLLENAVDVCRELVSPQRKMG